MDNPAYSRMRHLLEQVLWICLSGGIILSTVALHRNAREEAYNNGSLFDPGAPPKGLRDRPERLPVYRVQIVEAGKPIPRAIPVVDSSHLTKN